MSEKVDLVLEQMGLLEPIEGRELKNKIREKFNLHKESFPPVEDTSSEEFG